jgi:hypothetical protein
VDRFDAVTPVWNSHGHGDIWSAPTPRAGSAPASFCRLPTASP